MSGRRYGARTLTITNSSRSGYLFSQNRQFVNDMATVVCSQCVVKPQQEKQPIFEQTVYIFSASTIRRGDRGYCSLANEQMSNCEARWWSLSAVQISGRAELDFYIMCTPSVIPQTSDVLCTTFETSNPLRSLGLPLIQAFYEAFPKLLLHLRTNLYYQPPMAPRFGGTQLSPQ